MNELYTDYAKLYARIAHDRDFEAELNAMGALTLKAGETFVELFAGPAYHSAALQTRGTNATLVAIDCSAQMAAIATAGGFEGTYAVADAIQGLNQIENADLICVPRYSIGLVDDAYLACLMIAVAEKLRPCGVFLAEIHPDTLVEAATQAEVWSELGIHERIVGDDAGQLRCVWPAALNTLPGPGRAVEMLVQVTRELSGQADEVLRFTSREYLRTRAEVVALGERAGLVEDRDRTFQSAGGWYLAFRRAPAEEKEARLRAQAFGAPFLLATANDRDAQVRRSGLDPATHDSPLSLHVYNLL